MKPAIYTIFALCCFALNSVLCRLALRDAEIDAEAFTLIRVVSGAVFLMAALCISRRPAAFLSGGSWSSAFFLFAYAVCFSFAYLSLSAATGALILFGAVQLTMIGAAIVRGERPRRLEWAGLMLALGGLIYLVLPGLAAPPLVGALLMASAGAAWGFYTLRGKGAIDPLAMTAGNFARAVPMALVVSLPLIAGTRYSARGILLAVVSGALASGAGYAVWYAALKFLTPTRAAVLQLSVPLIAAAVGILFLAEEVSVRLVIAGGMILGGVGLVILKAK